MTFPSLDISAFDNATFDAEFRGLLVSDLAAAAGVAPSAVAILAIRSGARPAHLRSRGRRLPRGRSHPTDPLRGPLAPREARFRTSLFSHQLVFAPACFRLFSH